MFSFGSVAIDVGIWRYQQRLEQTAADSAALAGATEMAYNPSPAAVTTAAQSDSASNGFTNGSANAQVTVNTPPLAGAYTGSATNVEVVVAKPLPFRLAFFGKSTTVTARAVAGLSTVTRNCIYALDSANNAAITVNGGAIYAPKCGIASNGGYLFTGSPTVNAASIGYAGAGATLNSATFPTAVPAPAVAATDPCPMVAGCAYLAANPPVPATCQLQTLITSLIPITIFPGTYCSQMVLSGLGAVTFSPGVYNFQGGFANTNAVAMIGVGVTFYVAGGAFLIGAGTVAGLSAPTSGNTANVLVYEPPTNTSQITFNGSLLGTSTGMIYAPAATLVVNGGQVTSSLLMVANDLVFNNSTGINVPTSAFPGYAGHAVLSE